MRYLIRNIAQLFREIKKNLPATFLSSFGIIFLISILALSISIRKTVTNYLKERIFGELKINQIKITPKNDTSFIKFSSTGNIISNYYVNKIKKINGIINAQKVIRLNYPTSFRAGMLGRFIRTDMLISGVDKTFFKNTKLKWNDFKVKEYVPIAVPMFAMDLYNNFAATNGLPALGPKALKLFSLEIIIGKSSFVRSRKKEFRYKARIFGFTPVIATAGIIAPFSFIKDFCAKHSDDLELVGECFSCVMILATIKDINQIPKITQKIQRFNLKVESQMDIAKKIEKAIFLLDITLNSIMAIILLLTIIAIFNSYIAIIYNRSYRFSIQRLLGASKLRIVFTILIESVFVGVLYGFIGYFIGYYLTIFLSDNITEWLPMLHGLSFKLDTHKYLIISIIFSTAVSTISALVPAIFASNLNLFNALKR